MSQTVSFNCSQWMSNIFNEKYWLFVLKESSHNETIFKQNLLDGRKWQVVTTRSEIKTVISRVRRGSRDDRQWQASITYCRCTHRTARDVRRCRRAAEIARASCSCRPEVTSSFSYCRPKCCADWRRFSLSTKVRLRL